MRLNGEKAEWRRKGRETCVRVWASGAAGGLTKSCALFRSRVEIVVVPMHIFFRVVNYTGGTLVVMAEIENDGKDCFTCKHNLQQSI